MQIRRLLTVIFISWMSLVNVYSEITKDLIFENYNSRDGLYHPSIREIYQDKKGFIWLASSEGLVRFDGKEFTTLRQIDLGQNSLSDNNIFGISEDGTDNSLWVGTQFGGINKVNLESLETKNFLSDSIAIDTSSVEIANIKTIIKASKDLLLIGTYENGLLKFIPSTGTYIKIKSKFIPDNSPCKVYKLKEVKGNIWAASSEGLLKLNMEGEVLDCLKLPLNPNKKQNLEAIIDFDFDTKGNIIFITTSEIWRIDTTKVFTKILTPQIGRYQLSTIAIDWDNNIWFGTNGIGLRYIDISSGKEISFQSTMISKFGIQDNTIQALTFSDNQPVLWIGTKSGFSKLDLTKEKFSPIDVTEISGSANVYLVFEDSEKGIWFWTTDGMYKKSIYESNFHLTDIPTQGYDCMNGIIEDENKTVWISSTKGLFSYNIITNEINHILLDIKGVNKQNLNCLIAMHKVSKNNYLIASFMGMVEFNTQTKKYTLSKLPDDKYNNGRFFFSDFVISSDSNVWLGSREAYLVKYDLKTKQYSFYPSGQKSKGFEKTNFILGIVEGDDRSLWLSTYGDGLLRFDTKSNTFSKKYAINELNNYTYSIVKDTIGGIWVTTNFGICRFDQKSGKIESFGKSDGTFCDEFNEGAYYVSKSGEIYFGGTKGLVHFNPYQIATNQYSPPVFISKITYGGENITSEKDNEAIGDNNLSKEIIINQDKKNLIFQVSVLNYCGSENNKIAWKLDGYDSDWNYGRANEKIIYSNLPRGKYKLITKGSNNNNIWNEKGDSININIIAPFYETPIAWFLIGTMIIIIVSTIVNYRYNWQRKQKQKLEQLVKAKTSDLEQANEDLEISKIEILAQKGELEIHRNYLEETVERRTADLEKAKIKAEESDKLKTAFLANLSHEIRTPMNAIIGFSSLLNTNAFSLKEQKEFINLIMASSETLLVLIDDILDISRIETAQISINPTDVPIGNFMHQLFQSLTFENSNNDTEFLLEVDPEVENMVLKTDPTRLKQVISNLAGNALKFTKKGFVKITVKKEYYAILKNKGFTFKTHIPTDEEILFFSVEDTGLGIEQNNLEVIFEPFRKIESPKKEVYGGVGLGLSIVKKLILLLGGEIQVKSVIDEGSSFYFYLPMTDVFYKEDMESYDDETDTEESWI